MKKLISVSILIAFLSTAAFAEFKVSFVMDITQNLFSGVIPLDDDADPNNPNNRFPGRFDFFTENRNEMRQSEMFLRLDYVKEDLIDARLELTGHQLINRRDRGLREGYSFLDLFDQFRIGDFWVKGNYGNVSAGYGRFHSRGEMDDYRFDKNTWWDRRYTGANLTGMDALGPYRFFGYQMPGFRYTEVNNHRAIHGGEHNMLVGFKFGDFGLELSGSRLEDRAANHGNAVSLGTRISGVSIADLITFELMYGLTGRDPSMNMFGDSNANVTVGPHADGLGRWEHRYGIYGGFNLMEGALGLSFGYSGGFLAYELWEKDGGSPNEKDLQRFGPLFHAFDLKAQIRNIVPALTITAAVNASLSTVTGTKEEDDTWYMGLGILDVAPLREKQEEFFLGLAAGLNIGYELSEKLDIAAQIKNSAQWENFINDDDERNQFRNILGVSLTARYEISKNFDILGGLAMQIDRTGRDGTLGGTNLSSSVGDFYLGIPITLRVKF